MLPEPVSVVGAGCGQGLPENTVGLLRPVRRQVKHAEPVEGAQVAGSKLNGLLKRSLSLRKPVQADESLPVLLPDARVGWGGAKERGSRLKSLICLPGCVVGLCQVDA